MNDCKNEGLPHLRWFIILEDIMKCRWFMSILAVLSEGTKRPSELKKKLSGISDRVLHDRLNRLILWGLVKRQVIGDKPPLKVFYSLTSVGEVYAGIVKELENKLSALESPKATGDNANE